MIGNKKIPESFFHLMVLDFIALNQKPVIVELYQQHPLKLK